MIREISSVYARIWQQLWANKTFELNSDWLTKTTGLGRGSATDMAEVLGPLAQSGDLIHLAFGHEIAKMFVGMSGVFLIELVLRYNSFLSLSHYMYSLSALNPENFRPLS